MALTRSPGPRRVLVALLLVLVCAVSAGPASAHGDQGVLEVEAGRGATPLSVTVRARLVYANDRDPVSSATVLAEALGPNGATLPPVPLTGAGNGLYTGQLTVSAPGTWKVRVVATDPAAVAEASVDASETVTTTSGAPTTEPPTTVAGGDDDGGSFVAVMAGVIALVLVGGGLALLWQRRRPTSR